MKKNKKDITSYLTSEFINSLIYKYGFDKNTLMGGDLSGAKLEALRLTEKHRFKVPKHRLTIINAIKRSYNMIELYTALFNIMHARLNPKEKLSNIL